LRWADGGEDEEEELRPTWPGKFGDEREG